MQVFKIAILTTTQCQREALGPGVIVLDISNEQLKGLASNVL